MSEMCFKDVNDSEVKSELRFVDTRRTIPVEVTE